MTSLASASQVRTIDELVRYRVGRTPTTSPFCSHAYTAAIFYHRDYGLEPRTWSAQPPEVIGLSGAGDMDYLITMLAVAKLGHSIPFLSPRLSPSVRDKLLEDGKSVV